MYLAMDWAGGFGRWIVDSWNPIVQGLLTAAIGWVAALVYKRFREKSARQRRGALWNRMSGDTCAAVVADGHSDKHGQEWEWGGLMGVGDARAYAVLASRLHELDIPLELKLADNLADSNNRGGDLVLIGGPDVNRLTYQYLTEIEDSLKWHIPNSEKHQVAIVDKASGQLYGGKSFPDAEDGLMEDHGLITVTPNPFARDRWVVCLTGVFGPGTDAAAIHTSDPDFVREKVVKEGRPFQALIRATVINGVVSSTHLVAIQPL
jgi:hypothetical protein